MTITPYSGFGGILPLQYGHEGYDAEHSLLLVPDRWDALWELLYMPAAFLEDAQKHFTFKDEAKDYMWDAYGPMTIILEPLTIPCRASVEGLRIIASALSPALRPYASTEQTEISGQIMSLLPQWQSLSHNDWRNKVLDACSYQGAPCQGYFLVEYAFVTRVMVVRYVAPDPSATSPIYKEDITPVTFSDFLHGLGKKTVPRTAFMHFDLKGHKTDYTHDSVALMKATFAVDYIVDPIAALTAVCSPGNYRMQQGVAPYMFHYGDPDFALSGSELSMSKPVDGDNLSDFPAVNNLNVDFAFINGRSDPRVILESVDPWADGRVWTATPQTGRYAIPPPPPLPLSEEDAPHPCALIYVTVNGQGQWVIDPSSTLIKNYFAPPIPGGGDRQWTGGKENEPPTPVRGNLEN